MSKDTNNIFGGASKISGVFEAFSDDKVLVKIAKAGSSSEKLDDGFLVEGYQIAFQRGVTPRRFLNSSGVFYNVGFGQGTVSLRGIVGKKAAFDELLSADSDGVCKPLTITVYPSYFKSCDENGKNGDTSLAYVCGNAMAVRVDLSGQVDPQGIVLNTGNLTFQISALSTTKATN